MRLFHGFTHDSTSLSTPLSSRCALGLFVALLASPHLGHTQADEETNLVEQQLRAYVPILIANVSTTPTRTPLL